LTVYQDAAGSIPVYGAKIHFNVIGDIMSDRILKFSASWCGPCQGLKMALADVDLGLPVDDIDIDENRDAALEYGIRGVPTMILIRNDAEVKRMSGAKSVEEIRKWISE